MNDRVSRPDRVASYFLREWAVLLAVTVSGLIYNFGLLAAPLYEGRLAGTLANILAGKATFNDMLSLVIAYVAITAVVQGARYVKRFYVRRFANNVNRSMKQTLYASLIRKSKADIEREGVGDVITKAISDVDDCAEGMRKFTTELFDTGIAMLAYSGMLFGYDWRLTLICMLFPPLSYFLAEKMKRTVQRTGSEYKAQAGKLSGDTMDRAENAVTYRVFGCEKQRAESYEKRLDAYEKAAIKANIWSAAMPPLYNVICMVGAIFILYFGGKNVLGQGWSQWDIAIFTTFISCYTKLSVKTSKAAKLFNSVHKAQVSWGRIKHLMTVTEKSGTLSAVPSEGLAVSNLSFAYPNGTPIFEGLSFEAMPGQIIAVTGPVACGKSTLGKAFLCEYPYSGSIRFGGSELSELPQTLRRSIVGYLGHDAELLDDSIKNNILMGTEGNVKPLLRAVCLNDEVDNMKDGVETTVGSAGVRLSGGQAQRLALARTLSTIKPIMILDDPFSALDRDTEMKIFGNLRKICGDSIIILISHRLGLFSQADKVIWMEDGRAESGSHESLMATNPLYAKLFRTQEGAASDEK